MAILKIARMGHPILRGRAQPVTDPASPDIRRLVADMLETMEDAGGVGLAAPQVHVPLRVVVFKVPPERLGPDETLPADFSERDRPMVLINPVLEALPGPSGQPETELGWEGCLSVPGFRGVVPRVTRLRYRALGLDGQPFERVAEGFHARVVQHEYDHLDGILYPMRMKDLSLLGFEEEMTRYPLGDASDGKSGAGASSEEAESA
ncbi:MAG TPA: peptide deformylase [Alphaproteobacteria bacterium]|jgi:peptide deformylase